MSLGWDSYFVTIGGRTASIFVDLDPPPAEIIARLPHLLFIRIALQHPGDHGLSTDAELDALSDLERGLEARVERDLGGRYVGRFTHDGRRTCLIYVSTEKPILKEFGAFLRARGYPAEAWSEHDPEWARYFSWLYPAPEELQTIKDRRVVEQLVEAGDDLAVERDVEHWVYFRTDADRAAFLDDLSTLGHPCAPTWDGDLFGVRVTTHHSVDIHTLGPVVRQLFQAASKHAGEYDGWETQVVTR